MNARKQTFSAVLINTSQCGTMFANQKRFICPRCRKSTVLWLLPTTEVRDLPVKCKRCHSEMVLNIPAEEPEP